MAVGTVSTSILTDIANSIRFQAGVATLYKPREMAAAVAALDGSNAGDYQAQPYMELDSGVLPESVFEDIADAIRGLNGLSMLYQPGDMAQAILDLVWDVGLKPRAVLTSLGTLEFNYVDGRHCYSGGVPVNAWEIDPAGYSSASVRPYDDIKLDVLKVVFHSSWQQVGMTNASYLCNSFQSMTEVSGFENLAGITSAGQMFGSCPMLETIYATSFSNSGLSASLIFNGCNRLVGGTDGFVPSSTSGASVCKIGAGGVLTDPNNDARTWFYGHFYENGEAVLTATPYARCHARAAGDRADLRHREVRGARLHAMDRNGRQHASAVPDERDLRRRHGSVHQPEPELPAVFMYRCSFRIGVKQPFWREVDALRVLILQRV